MRTLTMPRNRVCNRCASSKWEALVCGAGGWYEGIPLPVARPSGRGFGTDVDDVMADSVLIIGGGIAGLSAGCYAQMNGYRSRILEMNRRPGGLCTSWDRNGYVVEGCLHWLLGTHPSAATHRLWRELGAVQDRPMVHPEEHIRVEGGDGRSFIVYADADRLREHIRALSPQDARVADELARATLKAARFDPDLGPPPEMASAFDRVRQLPQLLPLVPELWRYRTMTLRQFARRFADPLLQDGLELAFNQPDFALLAALFALGWKHAGRAGYPVGGARAFAGAIAKRYEALGGEMIYGAKVDHILVRGSTASGVQLTDSREIHADAVISACDGRSVLFGMLAGRFIDEKTRRCYDRLPIVAPLMQVSLGVAADLQDEPHHLFLALERPLVAPGRTHRYLEVKHYGYDPTLAPKGKTLLVALVGTEYEPWAAFAADRSRYEEEKQRVAEQVIARLESRFHGLAERIEMTDVTTPLTYERNTGTWKGSYQGWRLTPKTMAMMLGKGIPRTLGGLARFYMAGQWVQPGGGLPTAALTGRAAVQLLCRDDHRPFTTSMPERD